MENIIYSPDYPIWSLLFVPSCLKLIDWLLICSKYAVKFRNTAIFKLQYLPVPWGMFCFQSSYFVYLSSVYKCVSVAVILCGCAVICGGTCSPPGTACVSVGTNLWCSLERLHCFTSSNMRCGDCTCVHREMHHRGVSLKSRHQSKDKVNVIRPPLECNSQVES